MSQVSGRQQSKEERFWTWFVSNEMMLFDFERDRERIFDLLLAELHRVHSDLAFEIGPSQEGRRELVLSAGGNREAFPAIKALAAAAPAMPRWRVTKFRPRRNEPFVLEYGGKRVDSGEIRASVLSSGHALGLRLYFPDYSAEDIDIWRYICYLILDHVLGEYDVETKIGPIEFMSLDRHSDEPRVPLDDLAPLFDRCFERLRQ
jgi:hypothetical protein